MRMWARIAFLTGLFLLAPLSLFAATKTLPPPSASFDTSPITSLRSDVALLGNVTGLQLPLGISIVGVGAKKSAYTNPNVPVVNGRWNIKVFPPLSTGVYSATLVSGTSTLATATLTVGLRSLLTVQPVTTLPIYDVADGRLMRFSINAGDAGPVAIEKISFSISSANATVSDIGLYGFGDPGYSTSISSSIATSTPLNSALVTPTDATLSITPDTVLEIPKGTTYYFELDGTVTPSDTSYSLATNLLGDTFSDINTAQGEASTSNFVWSPNTYGVSSTTDRDWVNGRVANIPAGGFVEGRAGAPIPVMPTCSINTDMALLTSGQPVTITWTSTDATYSKWSDGVSGPASGSRTFISLAASTSYVLTVYGQYGTATCPVTVEVPLPVKVVATSTPALVDSLSATTTTSTTAPFAAKLYYSVNNAKSCSALTYTLGYGDGTASTTITVAKNTCKAQAAILSHSYTKTGTFIAGLYQSTGTSSAQLIQKVTITVGVKTSFLFDASNNLAAVGQIASNVAHTIGAYIISLISRFAR